MESPSAGNQAYVRALLRLWHEQYEDTDIPNYEDTSASRERTLREEVKKVLQENDAYSNDELCDVMAALKSLDVSTTRHFEYLSTEDLVSKGVRLVTARILMKEFGPNCDDSKSSHKEPGFWDYFFRFFEGASFSLLLPFLAEVIRLLCGLAGRFGPR